MTKTRTTVRLTVTGEQTDADGRRDSVRTDCIAEYEYRDGTHVFTYLETDPQSGAVTRSQMRLAAESCSIVRTGEINARMEFVPDRERHCDYGTPFGSLSMAIVTERIAMRQIGENFHARIRYRMAFEGADPVECAVTIKSEPVSHRKPIE